MPPLPEREGVREEIIRGLYLLRPAPGRGRHRARLVASGPILREALRAQDLLAERFSVAADVFSATSFVELRRDALAAERWNRLHPAEPPRRPYLQTCLEQGEGPVVAASDYLRAVPDFIARWVVGEFVSLGTDGFGCSDTRPALRRLFEVDAEQIAAATLALLAGEGRVERAQAAEAIRSLGIDPDASGPAAGVG